MFKKPYVRIFILVAMAFSLTACWSFTSAPTPTKPAVVLAPFTVPSYATHESVLHEVSDRLYGSLEVRTYSVVSPDTNAGDTIKEGNIGLLILWDPWAGINSIFPSHESYGQTCWYADHITYGLEQKVLVPKYTVSTDDPEFLTWCHDQFSKVEVYLVAATKLTSGEFSIEYHKENWDINPTFTSPN